MDKNARGPLIGWIVVVLLFAIAGALFWRSIGVVTEVPSSAQHSGLAHIGGRAPSIPLESLAGHSIALNFYRGKPLWVNFFATWCPPCKDELPEIERRYESRRSAGLVVVGVDQQEEPKTVKPFVKRFGLRYPVLIDPANPPNAYFLQALPTSVFIDRDGIVRYIQIGEMTPPMMDKALASIL